MSMQNADAHSPASAEGEPIPILSAPECHAYLLRNPRIASALCFVLWDRHTALPFLCGVTNSIDRMLAQLRMDTVRDGAIGLIRFHPELLEFVMAQPPGFLGVSLFPFDTVGQAKVCEHSIVSEFGRRDDGGLLLNRRIER